MERGCWRMGWAYILLSGGGKLRIFLYGYIEFEDSVIDGFCL